jgi:hypothetical protein
MITLPFTMPSPRKLSHHSPAPGKPPFFHHCYDNNNDFGGNNDNDDLGGGDDDNDNGNNAPPSYPPQLSCPQGCLISLYNLFDGNVQG